MPTLIYPDDGVKITVIVWPLLEQETDESWEPAVQVTVLGRVI